MVLNDLKGVSFRPQASFNHSSTPSISLANVCGQGFVYVQKKFDTLSPSFIILIHIEQPAADSI